MSENLLELFFENTDKPKSIKSVENKIKKILSDENISIAEFGSGKEKSDYHMSMWIDNVEALPLLEILKYLSEFPSKKTPYAKLTIDQTGHSFYHIEEDFNLFTFDSESELASHAESLGETSIEGKFYDSIDTRKSNLLVRIKFEKKSDLKKYSSSANSYVENPSDENFGNLKRLFSESNDFNKKFPCCGVHRTSTGNEDYYVKALSFCETKNKYLYLGFVYDKDVRIEPCAESNVSGMANMNIINDEGKVLLELMECFLCISDEMVQGKFESKTKGYSGDFWTYEALFYTPRWNHPPLPSKKWYS